MGPDDYQRLLAAVQDWQKARASGDEDEVRAMGDNLAALIPIPPVVVPNLTLRALALLAPKAQREQAMALAVSAELALESARKIVAETQRTGLLRADNRFDVLVGQLDSVDVAAASRVSAEVGAAIKEG